MNLGGEIYISILAFFRIIQWKLNCILVLLFLFVAAGSGVLFDPGPHLIDHALTVLGTPQFVTADVRIEREGFSTDDAFDICFEYPAGVRAQLSATMLTIIPRPRFFVAGTKGGFVKNDFDPLENALRISEPE